MLLLVESSRGLATALPPPHARSFAGRRQIPSKRAGPPVRGRSIRVGLGRSRRTRQGRGACCCEAMPPFDPDASSRRAREVFGDRLAVDVSHLLDRRLERAGRRAAALAEAERVPIVATGDVRCATPQDRKLLDALICLRERKTLATAGRLLPANGEGFLHTREEMVQRFADHPDWIRQTRVIAERCEFQLKDLDYRFPSSRSARARRR